MNETQQLSVKNVHAGHAESKTRLHPNLIRGALPGLPFVVLVVVTIFAKVIAPYDAEKTIGSVNGAPSAAHWFGTDSVGMDIFSRTLVGMQVSVRIALIVAVIATVLGVLIGTFIGLIESQRAVLGVFGRMLNRVTEYIITVPSLVMGIVIVGLMGAGEKTMIFALVLCLTQAPIRLTRVEVLRVRSEAYLQAAEMAGEGRGRSALVHVIPNALGPAMTNVPIAFGNSVMILASLGFLGIGIQAPTPEWGSMISSGISSLMMGIWWPTVFPSLFLFFTVICVAYTARWAPAYWARVQAARNR
ncbi:MAG: ABC transporter permease [Bifidobacterium tibiigranuli]|jgi:peptide/nickel transport system permease protein|uniref:ABC transporter permease n=1 Tax=Bifidobacterium tibiigranuli TaxID=2172043 RepID=UPI0026EB42E8|nr:ABC transporter permease [Bifidobacterium tibiigranuli]MCI1673678.1 ABC transporter permease [Bifidobacterium tibiigranuli]MCI1712934.1 ABC transporter permease [Bifidobacterium tibiigranuli]MCI1833559.1 ABC transporter permease [Bifidobacterium tibiigranuli]